MVSALRELMRGTTTLVISHDPGLVQCADRILVISAGRIVEAGTHDELLRSEGHYAGLQTGITPSSDAAPAAAPEPSPTSSTEPAPSGVGLVEGLQERLPGLATAVDEDLVGQWIADSLLASPTEVRSVSAGRFWLREDGSCTLRYLVELAGPDGLTSEHTVLGRVHADDEAASTYLAERVGRLLRTRRQPEDPWHRRAAAIPGSGLALTCSPSTQTCRPCPAR